MSFVKNVLKIGAFIGGGFLLVMGSMNLVDVINHGSSKESEGGLTADKNNFSLQLTFVIVGSILVLYSFSNIMKMFRGGK
jgi:hypothetical protein